MSARWTYLLNEAWTGLGRNMLMTIAVVMSVFVSLSLLGSSLLFRRQVDVATDEWYGKIEVSIFLCDGRNCDPITPEQQEELRNDLENDVLVERVYYESKAEAYASFREMFEDQPDFVESVGPDALPASFRVKLRDPQEFTAIYEKYKARPGVEEVVDQRDTLNPIFTFIDRVKWGALIVAGGMLVIAALLTMNTILLTAFARREQTSIMKLVGASNWYIRLPFVLEGVVAGLLGAVAAWVVLMSVVPAVTASMSQTIVFMPFVGFDDVVQIGPWLILAGVLTPAFSSLIALWSYTDV